MRRVPQVVDARPFAFHGVEEALHKVQRLRRVRELAQLQHETTNTLRATLGTSCGRHSLYQL